MDGFNSLVSKRGVVVACVKIIKRDVRALEGEWHEAIETASTIAAAFSCFSKEVEAQLNNREGHVPELIEWTLSCEAWAEQIDSAKVASITPDGLALDAVVAWVPRPILRLVGDT